MKKKIFLSCDVDTLNSIYKGIGCTGKNGYSSAEFEIGLKNILKILEMFDLKCTFFCVGTDFKIQKNESILKEIIKNNHEIANHTMTHPHNFKSLSIPEKKNEISKMSEACYEITGYRPVGFRAPGWNINDDTIAILKSENYIYDSSIFPTYFMPLMKILGKIKCRNWKNYNTSLGNLKYMFASPQPYQTSINSFLKKGFDGIIELPINTIPFIRLPFWYTFIYYLKENLFFTICRLLTYFNTPVHISFHLSDFVDYSIKEFNTQLPDPNKYYVPKSFFTPLNERIDIFKKIIQIFSKDYRVLLLKDFALTMNK